MTDLPLGCIRGDHAHRNCQQFLVCLAGALTVRLTWAGGQSEVTLDSPSQGLYVPARTWVTLCAAKDKSICLVLASHPHDEADYIRDIAELDV